jgi:2-C-methyl-D-erythritol 4-phosphate cytidylyltransferase
MSSFVSAVIVAAGSSTRMGLEKSKQFIDLCGRTVIERTLSAFETAAIIDSVVVVCRDSDKAEMSSLIEQNGFAKVRALVPGGSTRDESVKNGVLACDGRTTHLAIHDGARPLIQSADIENVVKAAFESGAAALGTLVTDTIKLVDGDNIIVSTPKRADLRAVQTPQVFEKSLYLRALEHGDSEGITDDCQLVESIGGRVKIIISQGQNIKLTTREDIKTAQMIIKERGE